MSVVANWDSCCFLIHGLKSRYNPWFPVQALVGHCKPQFGLMTISRFATFRPRGKPEFCFPRHVFSSHTALLKFFKTIVFNFHTFFPHCRSKKVSVPSTVISRVIGRGGCNINAIREFTGAHIDIDKQKDKTGDRIITIR